MFYPPKKFPLPQPYGVTAAVPAWTFPVRASPLSKTALFPEPSLKSFLDAGSPSRFYSA